MAPPPQIRDYPLFEVEEPPYFRWRSHLFIICYQISAVVPSTLVMSHGCIIKIPYLRWRSSFYLELLTCRSHQTPCKGRRSTTTTWEGGALGGEVGRKEPAVTEQLAAQVGAHPSHPAVRPHLFNLHLCCTGWCPSKPPCCATSSLQSSSLLHSVDMPVESRAEPKLPKKTWVLRGDQDGGSSGHLLGRRRAQVWEKATGDLHTVFGETFPQAFTRIVKEKVF